LSELSFIERIERLQRLNQKLVDVLSLTAYELIQYANKHNIEIPYKIAPLLEQALVYIDELKNPKKISQPCPICNKLNPENADFCCYCGSSLNITQISPDLLHENKNSKSPDNDTEPKVAYKSSLHFYITSLLRV